MVIYSFIRVCILQICLLLGMFDSQEVSFKNIEDLHSCAFVTLPVPESLVSQASGGLVIGEKLP